MSDYDEWPPRMNYPPPMMSDHWQRELIHIAGLSPNGLPILRLEWGSVCTWTPYVKDLKYLHRTDENQTGWRIDIRDQASGTVVRSLKLPFKVDTLQLEQARECGPTEVAGLPFPLMEKVEIGIPRWWISRWIPPGIIGPWDDARRRVMGQVQDDLDMGPMPREGLYYLGFHSMWTHKPDHCCRRARGNRQKCFGFYRPPSDLDMLYVKEMWDHETKQPLTHNWQEAADEATIQRNLLRLTDAHTGRSKKEREEMKARIRDTFKTTKARFTARKGVDTFIFTPYDKIMSGTVVGSN